MIKKLLFCVPILISALLVSVQASSASIEKIHQNTRSLTARGIKYSFQPSEPGLLSVKLETPEGKIHDLLSMQLGDARVEILWNGMLEGRRIPEGAYNILLFLDTGDGPVPADRKISFTVVPISPSVTEANDGTYWSMTPGELDDEEIWRILTQPIAVFNNGNIAPSGHAYLMENPDGTGKRVAQLHGLSQGVHILSDVNALGYVLVEAYSNYDPSYKPVTPEEKAHAFDIKQGYVKAECIEMVNVSQEYGILIDKLTQRMYLFQNGHRVTEFIISTGLITSEKYFRETVPGEFTTISFTKGFWNDDVYSALGIRYNGGSLIHEVPSYIRDDGTPNYTIFERDLGKKSSGNCVRVQRLPNGQGLNQQWLFDTLKSKDPTEKQERYKVIIWDDIGRVDRPLVWAETPG